jgi:hypothetical protein
VFRRRDRDPDLEAAEGAVKERLQALSDERKAIANDFKARRDALQRAIKTYTKQVENAQRALEAAFEDREIAALGNAFGGAFSEDAPPRIELRTTTIKVGKQLRPLTPDLKATVETEGNLATKSRVTLTRIGIGGAVAGPVGALLGAGIQKSQRDDVRGLYLLLEADSWAQVRKCNPDQGQQARDFAQKVNLAARQVVQAREMQLRTARGAREVLVQAVADRDEMLSLDEALRSAMNEAWQRLRTRKGALHEAAEQLDAENKLRRQAEVALGERDVSDRLVTEIAIPEPVEVLDEHQLHHGAAAVRRLSSALPRLDRLGRKGLNELADAVQPGEEPLLVVLATRETRQGAALVTSHRLLLGFDELESVDRADVLTAGKAGLFAGSVKVQVRERGELVLSSLKPDGIGEDLAALLSQPVDVAGPALAGAPDPPALPAPAQPDILDQVRKLGELRDAGVLTEEEFAAKKAELLRRL